MECAVEDQLLILEKRTMLLASAVGVCPFLGLFGTVWGITVAFSRLAQAGRADVQTLAPGVSGALLTTVLAIFVVIPAMLGNNYIVSLLKTNGTLLDDTVEEIIARFQTEYM
jgi:biopolymer transport protein TolQ